MDGKAGHVIPSYKEIILDGVKGRRLKSNSSRYKRLWVAGIVIQTSTTVF